MKVDRTMAMWIVGIVFIAGGGWWHLESVASDVVHIQETLDSQKSELAIHVASAGHQARSERMSKVEEKQEEMARDIKALIANQSAICQATGARCR